MKLPAATLIAFAVIAPTWGGLRRVPVHAADFVLGDDGSVTVLGETRVARLSPDGTPDTPYGKVDVGDATFGRLLAEPGGGVRVYRTPFPQPRPTRVPDLVLDRLSASGARTRAVPRLRFGGGGGLLASRRTGPLRQSGFAVGEIVPRPDGSLLAAGGVSLVQYTGEGRASARRATPWSRSRRSCASNAHSGRSPPARPSA